MFKNKKVNIVISIIVAIAIWAYVVGEINPTVSDMFKGIKVEFTGSETLNDEGLALVDPGEVTVNVTAVGARATIKKLTSDDFTATVNLRNCGRGENKIAIEIDTPKNVKIESSNPETISVQVDNLVTERKDVKAVFTGLGKNREASEVETNPNIANVTGAESQVDNVAYIKATVDAKKIKGEVEDITTTGTPVDKEGKEVKYVAVVDKSINVKASIAETKTVDLKADVTGSVANSVQLDKVEIPKTVKIKGSEEALKDIDSVTATPINISGIKSNSNIPISLNLPEGIEVAAKDEDLAAKVTVKGLSSKTFEFSSGNIETRSLADGLKVKVKDSNIKGKVAGDDKTVGNLAKSDVGLFINLYGMTEGTHKVNIRYTLPDGISSLVLNPKYVEIEISEE